MAGRRDIEAGRAFVSLALNDSAFVKGLRRNGERLKNFGRGLATIGAGITAAGAAITAPLAVMLGQFLKVGDALDKMRQRTGISVEALSELQHAAGQSGTSLEMVEKGVRRMQQELGKAGPRSAEFTDALDALGLSVESLEAMNPEEQFNSIANAIGKIEDPTKRAGTAVALFGRAGTQLLPMIEDMEALRQEARELGFTMDGESAAAAVKLGDMLENLRKTVTYAGVAIGQALAPPLMKVVAVVQKFSTGILKWIQANKQLVVTIAAIGVGLTVVGAAITAFGLSVAVAGVAMTGLATAIGAMGAVLGVLTSPLGIITGLLAAGVYLWANFTESGRNAVDGMKQLLGDLLQTATMTFGGIYDAVAAGDLALAGQIAMAGLKLAFLQGLDALSNAVGGAFGDFIGTIGTEILSGDLSGAWQTVLTGISEMLATFVNGALDMWTQLKHGVYGLTVEMWAATEKIFIEGSAALLKTIMSLADAYFQFQALFGRDTSVERFALGMLRSGIDFDKERQKRTIDMGASAARAAVGVAGATEISDNAAAREATAAAFRGRTRGGASGASDAASAAESELETLRARAAAARQQAEDERRRRRDQTTTDDMGMGGMASRVFGTFSAAAFQATGQNPALTEQKKTNKKLENLENLTKEQLDFIKATGAWA